MNVIAIFVLSAIFTVSPVQGNEMENYERVCLQVGQMEVSIPLLMMMFAHVYMCLCLQ